MGWLVTVVNVGTTTVEGGAVERSADRPRSTDPFINCIKVGLGFLDGAEPITAVLVAHVQADTILVGDEAPFGPVQGFSVNDGGTHIAHLLFLDKYTTNI